MYKVITRILIMLGLYFVLRNYGGQIGRNVFYPIQLLVTFLHELGHALGAIITGGSVINIQINPNGSGYTTTSGGSRAIILMGGYLGSAIFGNILFLIGARSKFLVKPLLWILGISMIVSGTIWFNSLFTTGFLFLFSLILLFIAWKTTWGDEVIMFLGLACILYIIQDFNVGPRSDLQQYSELMKVLPTKAWMYIWLFLVVLLFFLNLKALYHSLKKKGQGPDDFMDIDTTYVK